MWLVRMRASKRLDERSDDIPRYTIPPGTVPSRFGSMFWEKILSTAILTCVHVVRTPKGPKFSAATWHEPVSPLYISTQPSHDPTSMRTTNSPAFTGSSHGVRISSTGFAAAFLAASIFESSWFQNHRVVASLPSAAGWLCWIQVMASSALIKP